MRQEFWAAVARRVGGTAAIVALTACGGEGGTTNAPAAASVAVSSATTGALTSVGDTRAVTAVVRDAAQNPISGAPVTWTTSNAAVATVSGSGTSATITATGNGSATITASSGAVSGTIGVDVAQRFASVTVTAAAGALNIGATTQLTATARDARGAAIPGAAGATFTTADRTRALVDGAGLVTAIAPGGVTLTASITRDGVTASGSATVTVNSPVSGSASAAVNASNTNLFTPASVTVAEGGTVTWTFGSVEHNVVFQSAGAPANIGITSSATASRVFPTAGAFPYVCSLHAGMTGTINVAAASIFSQMNGANERPNPVPSSANGAALFTRNGTTVNYTVTYQGIASNPTGLHIHAPATTSTTSGIIVDLMPTPVVGTSGVLTGSFTAANIRSIAGAAPIALDSLMTLLRTGNAYVNVHSSAYPGGEIRGQTGTP